MKKDGVILVRSKLLKNHNSYWRQLVKDDPVIYVKWYPKKRRYFLYGPTLKRWRKIVGDNYFDYCENPPVEEFEFTPLDPQEIVAYRLKQDANLS